MQEGKICPYPGLRPFNEEESIFFRGREEHIEKIISQLEERKFVMLTGASGDGKSSIVYAGVIPNARAGFFKAKFNNWIIADFRPERSPLKNMAASLTEKLGYADAAYVEKELAFGFSSLIDLYKKSPFYLDQTTNEWNNTAEAEQKKLKRKAANLFILVDQFEEFFTNSENYNNGKPSVNSQAVINLLLETAKIALAQDLPIYIICTMRSDYVGQCATFRGLPEHIGFSQFFVPRLKRKEVHQVIEEPATLSGNKISNRLIEALINECDGHDQLPILQHALNRIWKSHMEDDAEQMDMIHYAKVGGMGGKQLPYDQKEPFALWYKTQPEFKQKFLENASLTNVLNAHARDLFETSVDYCRNHIGREISREEARRILKNVFTCLTKINDSRAVRNRATVLEIKQIIGGQVDNKLIEGLINAFREPENTLVKPFILTASEIMALEEKEKLGISIQTVSDYKDGLRSLHDNDILDITHESLIRNWTDLTDWTKQDHENVSVINDLKKQVERWEQKKRSKDYLLTIGSLSYFKNWYYTINPNPYLIAKYDSSNVSPTEKLAEAGRFIQPAEDFLKISESTIKRKRKLTLIIASVVAVILIGFTSWALVERSKALEKTEEARKSEKFARDSENNALQAKNTALRSKENAQKSEKIAMTAKQQAELSKQEALVAMSRAEKASLEADQNLIQAKQNADLAKSETERATIALIESEKAKQDAIISKNSAERSEKEASRISNLSLAQSVALKSELLRSDPQLQGLLAYQAYKLTLDNKGNVQDPIIYAAVRSSLFNLNKQAAVSNLTTTLEQRTAKLLSDNTLLSADKEGNVYKWELASEKKLGQAKLRQVSPFEVITVTNKPNIIISGHENGNICIWDVSDFSNPSVKELKGHKGALRVITISESEELFATAGKDSSVIIWKFQPGGAEQIKEIKTTSTVQDLIIVPGGKELVIALKEGGLITVDVASGRKNLLFDYGFGKPWCLKLNTDNTLLAAGYTDGKIRLFDVSKSLNSVSPIFTFSENNTMVEKMAFNKNNTMLAVASADKSIKIFNLAKKTQKQLEIKDIKSKTRFLIFDSENKLYACGSDHIIRKIEPFTEKMTAPFCDLLKRNLTPAEWEQNVSDTMPYEKTCKDK